MAASTPQPPGVLSTGAVGGEGTSDAEVMLRVKAGDQSAFDYLVQKYRRPMISFLYRMAHNAAAAEDLAQEVFLRVYRSRESYEASAKFTTWLYRIATNLAVNHTRDTRHERPELTVSLDEPDEETGSTVELPDGKLTAEQAMVQKGTHARDPAGRWSPWPELQRLAVIMHKYQQMDYRQHCRSTGRRASRQPSRCSSGPDETLREQLKEYV